MDSVDRDQTVVRQALEVFEQLVSQYPASTYAQKAQQRMDECRKSLAGHEMYVGRYYFKAKHYQGALARFQNTLSNYPNTGFDQEAQDYISRCQEALENKKATN